MNKIITWVIGVVAILALVVSIGNAVGGSNQSVPLGGTTNFDDLTLGGGTLKVTTSNTATSTAIVGCIQTYATSTATAVRLVVGSIATSSTSYDGTNTVGLIGWRYGTCPNL